MFLLTSCLIYRLFLNLQKNMMPPIYGYKSIFTSKISLRSRFLSKIKPTSTIFNKLLSWLGQAIRFLKNYFRVVKLWTNMSKRRSPSNKNFSGRSKRTTWDFSWTLILTVLMKTFKWSTQESRTVLPRHSTVSKKRPSKLRVLKYLTHSSKKIWTKLC